MAVGTERRSVLYVESLGVVEGEGGRGGGREGEREGGKERRREGEREGEREMMLTRERRERGKEVA